MRIFEGIYYAKFIFSVNYRFIAFWQVLLSTMLLIFF